MLTEKFEKCVGDLDKIVSTAFGSIAFITWCFLMPILFFCVMGYLASINPNRAPKPCVPIESSR